MALGTSDNQRRFDDPVAVLGDRLRDGSIYKLLAENGHELFGDDYFADCYSGARDGRPTVSARILATVMILQAFEGLSDREAVDRLGFDLDSRTVTCPAGQVAVITRRKDRSGVARFAPHCGTCPLLAACTKSRAGRSITINEHEAILQRARTEQTDPEWIATYRANRPLVERKIAHLVRRGWGGRRGRTRGLRRIATDLDTRASAINWARLATLGLNFGPNGWTLAGG